MKKPQHIVILGAGESGVGAALLAKQKGYKVLVSDTNMLAPNLREELSRADIDFEEGGHSLDKLLQADLVVKSPGIPQNAAVVVELRLRGVEIVSEIEFGFRHCPHRNIIAVTGTNGKTTTCKLIYDILQRDGQDVGLAGNIGYGFCRMLAIQPHDCYVLEVSSFQLEDCYMFHPHIAVLTNLAENHLDRYNGSMDAYAAAKFRIVQRQGPQDHFITSMDSPEGLRYLARHAVEAQLHLFSRMSHPAVVAWTTATSLHFMSYSQAPPQPSGSGRSRKNQVLKFALENQALAREANRQNAMAAGVVANLKNARKESIRDSFTTFENEPHRLEKVNVVEEVEFINDSKATNVNATWYALSEFKKPVIWIAGGVDKGADFTMLADMVEKHVRALVTIGRDGKRIQEAFGHLNIDMQHCDTMDEAVALGFKWAKKGESVLLSPAMASFDMFSNYEFRGEAFKAAIRRIVRNLSKSAEEEA